MRKYGIGSPHKSIQPKTARDRRIDAAIDLAAKEIGPQSQRAILIRGQDAQNALATKRAEATLESQGKKLRAVRANRPKPQMPPTELELALTKVGLVKSRQEVFSKKAVQVENSMNRLLEEKVIVKKSMSQVQGRQSGDTPRKAQRQKAIKSAAKVQKSKVASAVRKLKSGGSKKRIYALKRSPVTFSDDNAKAERMMERQKSAANFIASIDQKSFDELLNSWCENVVKLAPNYPVNAFRALASDLTNAIEDEWKRRAKLALLDPEHFKWPSTTSSRGDGVYSRSEFSEGVLGYLGYHVGKSGEPNSEHRQIKLSRIFEGYLPPINGPIYMRQWGEPSQPKRLQKMAESIAYVIRTRRHLPADYSVAIEHWEEDLQFLYERFYTELFGFGWPRTD